MTPATAKQSSVGNEWRLVQLKLSKNRVRSEWTRRALHPHLCRGRLFCFQLRAHSNLKLQNWLLLGRNALDELFGSFRQSLVEQCLDALLLPLLRFEERELVGVGLDGGFDHEMRIA